MKKIGIMSLACILLFSLFACSQGVGTVSSKVSSEATQSVPQDPIWWTEPVEALPLEVNPVTGLPLPEGYVKGQRAVAIMVANEPKAFPQRGLAAADLVYEMETEKGYTRLMAIYSDYRNIPEVGPVRSTYDQFVQLAIPQNFVLQHIGTTVYASNLLVVEDYKTVDGINVGTIAYKFDQDRSNTQYSSRGDEYCWFTDAGLLWNGMERLDIFTSAEEQSVFRFATQKATPETNAYNIRVIFSDVVNSSFEYDEGTGLYNKNVLDQPHTDQDGTRLSYTNVFVLQSNIKAKADSELLDFDFSSGTGYYFTAGGVQEIQWHKGGVGQELRFADMDGNMLEVQPGKSYIGIVPAKVDFETISFKSKEEVALAAAEQAAQEGEAAEEEVPVAE